MRPLAQTFLINEQLSGVEAVFVTAIDLYFVSKPTLTSMGVEVQLRETLNGVPLPKQLPYASKSLSLSEINVSSDASVATRFTFRTPVLVRTNELVAVAVIPIGGSPDYRLWTAERDRLDVSEDAAGAAIVFPNNVGNLYAPSNDLSYTPIQNQCLKFSIVTANFTSLYGTAAFKSADLEYFITKPAIARFATNEKVMLSNNNLKLAMMNFSAMATPFTVGEVVVMPNTAANVAVADAYGTVYFANTTTVRLKSVGGDLKFTTTGGGLKGLTSTRTTGNPTAAYTNTLTTSACTVITVPTTNTPGSDFNAGALMYVGRPSLANTQVAQIVSIDETNRQITLDRPITITETDAVYGRVRGDGNLNGQLSFDIRSPTFNFLGLHTSTANSTTHFANSVGQILIGTDSGTAVKVDSLINLFYDSITPQVSAIDSKDTSVRFTFSGYGKNYAPDGSYSEIFSEVPYEFIDKERILYSRSNEVQQFGSSDRSLTVKADLQSTSPKFSPYIDVLRTNTIVTSNQILPDDRLNGYYISFDNSNGVFVVGSTVWQGNSYSNTSANVVFANSTFITVNNLNNSNTNEIAAFNANGTSIITGAGGVTANVVSVKQFNEALGNGSKTVPRYVSKTVILAEGQDSEDLVVFLTAYRPPGTDIKVYGKLLNAADSDPFNDKSWTPMTDTTEALFSSLVNREDYLELKYELPQTVAVHTSNISVNTTSANIVFTSSKTTDEFRPGMFVYVSDSTNKTFAVRKVIAVPNTSTLVVASNLTFDSVNSAIGYISGSLAQCNAFRNNLNNGIVRYVCRSTDSAFDGYKTFAIKIVLTADSTQVIPRVADMRALALQI